MNDHINELVEQFINNNVSTIKAGLDTLETFFNNFELHPMKQEFQNLNRDGKRELVKALLSNIENNPSKIVSETISQESNAITPVNNSEGNSEENSEQSVQELLQQDIAHYLNERNQLLQKLLEVDSKLNELGHSSNAQDGSTKMDQCKHWRKMNQNATRAQFMNDMKDIGSKAMLSTYWQKIK